LLHGLAELSAAGWKWNAELPTTTDAHPRAAHDQSTHEHGGRRKPSTVKVMASDGLPPRRARR
jgi:hypothetical protein